MQLVLHEQCCSRGGVDVFVDGQLVVDDHGTAASVHHVFVAQSNRMVLNLEGSEEPFDDRNPILNALTLEVNHESRRLYPSPLVHRVLVDFHRNEGLFQAIFSDRAR